MRPSVVGANLQEQRPRIMQSKIRNKTAYCVDINFKNLLDKVENFFMQWKNDAPSLKTRSTDADVARTASKLLVCSIWLRDLFASMKNRQHLLVKLFSLDGLLNGIIVFI